MSPILVPSLGWPGRLYVPATVGEQKRVRAMVQLFTSIFHLIIDYGSKNSLTCTCMFSCPRNAWCYEAAEGYASPMCIHVTCVCMCVCASVCVCVCRWVGGTVNDRHFVILFCVCLYGGLHVI